MLNWLKHAFSVESSGLAIPTESQVKLIDLVCREIVRRGMTLPAQMMLESSVPLHFLAGQMLRFVEPFLGTVLNAAEVRDFATFIEQRGAVEYICRRLAELQEIESRVSATGTPREDITESMTRPSPTSREM